MFETYHEVGVMRFSLHCACHCDTILQVSTRVSSQANVYAIESANARSIDSKCQLVQSIKHVRHVSTLTSTT